jgi:capsular polysaccharide transport system ATP-binding protein
MIRFDQVVKSYKVGKGHNIVLDHVSITFPTGGRVGIMGVNGAGKSTLLRLIAGSEEPDHGTITRVGRISFPVGFTGSFHPNLTARENVRFLADVYDMDLKYIVEWIEDFAELGKYFEMPLGTYSSGMAARLAIGTSLAFDFDVYLLDEVIAVGDERFQRKCQEAFSERMATSSMILVSHNPHAVRQYCTSGAVLHGGRLAMFTSLDEAIDVYQWILRGDRDE